MLFGIEVKEFPNSSVTKQSSLISPFDPLPETSSTNIDFSDTQFQDDLSLGVI